tara:strand:+ start:247 stop:870 length:624 start_codon:yes stop_codon:yes gene_type:complete
MTNSYKDLCDENGSLNGNCNLCKEVALEVGDGTEYGSIIVCKLGSGEDGWFATLSPKTGGDPEKDFTIQINSNKHLTHFSQIDSYPELAKNYGIMFAKVNAAVTKIMVEETKNFETVMDSREEAISVATYGKCTNWKDKKEHLHIKVFPFKRNIGQPYTVDSSFGRKEIFRDDGEEFIKMDPVRKVEIDKKRFEDLSNRLIDFLNKN